MGLNINMSIKISCYTLFDITHTAKLSRHRPDQEQEYADWLIRRNAQCNFDTVLQVISLRSQPELIFHPKKINIRFDEFENFGFLFQQEEEQIYPCWTFDFNVQHDSVFNDGISELGYLYSDCDNVPMILCGTEWHKLPSFLDCSNELRNIYFETKYN